MGRVDIKEGQVAAREEEHQIHTGLAAVVPHRSIKNHRRRAKLDEGFEGGARKIRLKAIRDGLVFNAKHDGSSARGQGGG